MEGDARGAEAPAGGVAGGLAEAPSGGPAGESVRHMTEHECIVVSNLARVRMMWEILGRLHSIWGVLPADDLSLMRVQITRWELALEDEVNKLMGKKKLEGPDA